MKETVFLSIWTVAVGVACLPHAHALPYSTLLDDPAFSPTRTSRHLNLLGGLTEGVDSAMFDSVVEFFFTNFGEEVGVKGRSYDSRSDFNHPPTYSANNNFEGMHTGNGYNNYMTGNKHEDHGKPEKTCIDVYGLSHSGSFCLDVFAALSVTGAALLIQLLFFIAKDVFCPHLKRNDDSIDGVLNGLNNLLGMLGAGNMSSLFAIDNSNTVTVDAVGGDMLKTGDGEGSIFNDKEEGQFAACDTIVFIEKDQFGTAMAGQSSEDNDDSESGSDEDRIRANFLEIDNTEDGRNDPRQDGDDDDLVDSVLSASFGGYPKPTTTTTTTTTTTPKPTRGPILMLLKESQGVCYVTSAMEPTGFIMPNAMQWRSFGHTLSPSLLLQAKDWFMDEARLFGYRFGGENSPLCRILSYFV